MPKTSILKSWTTNATTPVLVHIGLILAAVVLSLGFYFPLLQGKVIQQSDILQYDAMSRQLQEHRTQTGEELYWIDNAFGGMPTYQLGAQYAYDLLGGIHRITRVIPRPAHSLFLYLVGAYFLGIMCGLSWPVAAFLSLAYGFSTYLLIILQVGHNTKALALAYMPFVFGGWVLLQQRKWLLGFLVSSVALGMNIRANHYQMTYYMLMLLGLLILFFLVDNIRKKTPWKTFISPVGAWILAFVLALGFNAPPLLATAEYTDFSTRGASELRLNPNGSPKEQTSGLDFDYITQYSYGIFESFNLISPQIQGGASGESLPMDSALGTALLQAQVPRAQVQAFLSNAPTYWGDQPILEAPAYLGVVVFFIFILGIWTYKGPYKLPLLIGLALALALSWGKNFEGLSRFFIDYFPLYNKFRAVSSIQVLLALGVPWLAALGLQSYLQMAGDKQRAALKNTALLFFGTILILWFSKGMLSFSGASDVYYRQVLGEGLMPALLRSRQELFDASLWRTFLFAAVTTLLLLWMSYRPKQHGTILGAIILLIFVDLYGVIDRYIRPELFVSPRQLSQSFPKTAADNKILQDTSRFRVYEPRLGLSNARTSKYHLALGGYHGAKPRRFEELMERMEEKQMTAALHFLNVKYVIRAQEQQVEAIENPSALGPAWAIDSLAYFSDADQLMKAMETLDPASVALALQNEVPKELQFSPAQEGTSIAYTGGRPDQLTYAFSSPANQLVVFSEMYYAPGWKAYVDGQETPHFPLNYVLRAMVIPAGEHQVEFKFDPPVVSKGENIRLMSYAIWVLALLAIARIQKNNPS